MATTKVKSYNIQPYYDDFDETKNYHRVLFRPGYAVQARELTQLQTALQNQIERGAAVAYTDGSRVSGGYVTHNLNYDFIKLETSFSHSVGGSITITSEMLAEFVGSKITGYANGTNEVTADVVGYAAATDASNPHTLYITYADKGGDNRDVGKFVNGEEIITDARTTSTTVRYGKLKSSGAVGVGSSASITQGVYFVNGTYVYVPSKTIILDKYTNTPTYRVGLSVTENLVSSDTSGHAALVDNATGTPNFAAPGANRYQIELDLVKEASLNATLTNYIPCLEIENGKVAKVDVTAAYEETTLWEALATRTSEESGDYTISPYELDIKEYLNTGSNFGYKTTAQIIADGNAGNTSAATTYGQGRLNVELSANQSYVEGRRIDHSSRDVAVEKPRGADATATVNAASTQIRLGNYCRLKLSTVAGLPDITNYTTMNLINHAGANIGTARARGMEIVGAGSTGYAALYLFDIAMTGSNVWKDTRKVSQSDSPLAFTAELINEDGSVGPAPQPAANSDAFLFDSGTHSLLYKLPYDAVKELPNNDNIIEVQQGFKVTSAASGGTVTFTVSGSDTFVDSTNNIIAVNGGSFMKLDGSGSYTLSTNNTTTLVVSGVPNSTSCELIATVRKNEAAIPKTRVNNATKANTVGSGKIGLNKADVIRIVSVTDGNSVDVTERFTLDNGQTDNYYAPGSAVLKPGYPTPTGTCTVTFDYYTHGSGTYFSVDSYPSADYETIGTYTSTKSGTVYELRDCLDFRPRKDDNNADFTSTGAHLCKPPSPSHTATTDVTYYMPRIDKLYVNKLGEFLVEKGVPADNPKAPEAPNEAMGLYDLHLKPYVFSTSDLKPRIIDNRRYTMRDIGALDKRIKNLEYYTSLSLLEQSAADAHIVDSAGLSRFKNGFLVDSFRGHNVVDSTNNDYNASIDDQHGVLTCKAPGRSVNLVRKASDSGSVVISGSIAHLPIASNTTIINQPYSSGYVNVNPFNVWAWDGKVDLSPDSDEWKEVDQRPALLIDDTSKYDQFEKMANETGILGTVWNEWETNWFGQEIDESVTRESIPGGGPNGENIKKTTTTTTTTTSHQSQSGLNTSLTHDTVVKHGENKVVSINVVPFMRSREIYFKASMLRPNTKFYAFFGGADITAYCKQKSFVEFATRSNIVDHKNVTSHPDSSSGSLTTTGNGDLEGSFILPNNSALKFQTGTKLFRLSDDSTNSKDTETSHAEVEYQARGVLEIKQSTITSTKVPRLETSEMNQDRTIVDSKVSETVEWIDPIAESILITEDGGTFATSVDVYFQSKVPSDAPIQTQVRLTIREMYNGMPTQTIVPGADKSLSPSSVNVSSTAATATNFAFDHPVYLRQDHEYAIVLTSKCDHYNVWVAEMGKMDMTNPTYRIQKQPYNGVFFTSANASTWTPEQYKDLKFKLNSAVFSTSGEITLNNDIVPLRALPSNPFTTTQNSGVITVNHPMHGLPNNSSKVTFAGATAFNGIAANNINGQRTVTPVDLDSYTFTAGSSDVSTNSSAGIGSGGGTAVTSTENRLMDRMYNKIQHLTFPGTSLRFYATTRTGKSISGSETPYQAGTEFEILPNRVIEFINPRMISNADNETANQSGAKSYALRCAYSTTKTNLSPIIDMNRTSVAMEQNRINSGSAAETAATGGNNFARYITKSVELADDADVITAFLDVNRPAASNVDFYYRVLTAGSLANMNDTAWILAPSNATIGINDNPAIYEEVQYDIDPLGANVSFGTMQFKIVLRSTNSSTPPRVKAFRAIAAT